MFNSLIIPQNIISKAEEIFPKTLVMKGQKILETGRVSVSFNRERETRFLLSGIVTDSSAHQSKIQSNLNNGAMENFSSQCNCQVWTEDGHCPHTAALFLHYKLAKMNEDKHKDSTDLKAHVSFHGQSVHVDHYGRLEIC